MKPVFISRDGVINTRLEEGVTHRNKLELIAGSIETMAKLSRQGFTVIIVTHQPGLSRGVFDLDEMDAIHAKISDSVENYGGEVTAIFYCPHDENDHCHCRPPATGLLDVIEIELDCGASDAYYFCDNAEEAEVAEKKGCHAILCTPENTLQQMCKTLKF